MLKIELEGTKGQEAKLFPGCHLDCWTCKSRSTKFSVSVATSEIVRIQSKKEKISCFFANSLDSRVKFLKWILREYEILRGI